MTDEEIEKIDKIADAMTRTVQMKEKKEIAQLEDIIRNYLDSNYETAALKLNNLFSRCNGDPRLISVNSIAAYIKILQILKEKFNILSPEEHKVFLGWYLNILEMKSNMHTCSVALSRELGIEINVDTLDDVEK